MATVARTVHLTDPETGELNTLLKGEELSDEEYDAFVEKYNNPSIFEDPDADGDGALDDLGDEEFFFAADANGTVDPDSFDERLEARRQAASDSSGGIDFGTDISGYSSWKIGDLRDEYNARVSRGVDMPEADMKNKQSLASALTATDDAGNA